MKTNEQIILSDWDSGYWCAVQNALSAFTRPDTQMAKHLIKNSGLTEAQCLALIKANPFYGEELSIIVRETYPND